jgi:HSP20 family protein
MLIVVKMNLDDERNRRRRDRDPFDMLRNLDEFNGIFRAMERMMEKAFRDMPVGDIKPGRSYVHGFNINIGSDGKPRIQEFGNYPKKAPNGETRMSEEREPLVDIIENRDNVAITVELPGVEKEDIDLDINDEKLEINVDRHDRKYRKIIYLPCNIKPKTTKTTYKNGVLDIEIEKKEKGDDKGGYKVNIE